MTTPTHTDTPGRAPGRGWAYTGALLGGAVSIAANIAHSYIPPTGAPSDWSPETGAVIGSVFWPIALFVAVEILTRIPWPTGRAWTLLRFGGLVPVALVAAVVSYRHLSGLLNHYGEDALTVVIGPLAVDGLMIMATGALLATSTHTTTSTEPVTEPAPAPADEPATTTGPATTAPVETVREPQPVTTSEPEPVTEPDEQGTPEPVTLPAAEPTEPATEQPVFAPWAPQPATPRPVSTGTPRRG